MGYSRGGRTRREEEKLGERGREKVRGNPGEEETAVVEGLRREEKEIVRERERRGRDREGERERERGWRLKGRESSVSPRKELDETRKTGRESGMPRSGVLQRRGARRDRERREVPRARTRRQKVRLERERQGKRKSESSEERHLSETKRQKGCGYEQVRAEGARGGRP